MLSEVLMEMCYVQNSELVEVLCSNCHSFSACVGVVLGIYPAFTASRVTTTCVSWFLYQHRRGLTWNTGDGWSVCTRSMNALFESRHLMTCSKETGQPMCVNTELSFDSGCPNGGLGNIPCGSQTSPNELFAAAELRDVFSFSEASLDNVDGTKVPPQEFSSFEQIPKPIRCNYWHRLVAVLSHPERGL